MIAWRLLLQMRLLAAGFSSSDGTVVDGHEFLYWAYAILLALPVRTM